MTLTYPSTLGTLTERVYQRLLTSSTAQDHITPANVRDALNYEQKDLHQELCLLFAGKFFVKKWEGLTPVGNRIEKPSDLDRMWLMTKVSGDQEWPVLLVDPPQQWAYQYRSYFASGLYSVRENWTEYPTYLKMNGSGTASGSYNITGHEVIQDLQEDEQPTMIPSAWQETLVDGAAYRLAVDAGLPRADELRGRMIAGREMMKRQAALSNMANRHRVRRVSRGRR